MGGKPKCQSRSPYVGHLLNGSSRRTDSMSVEKHECGDGDYYRATFEAEQDTDDPDSPYLLIQRQFEDPDDNRCYIEMHDEKYRGHFLLRHVGFTPQKLSIELDRPRDNLVSVTFAMAATEFTEAS